MEGTVTIEANINEKDFMECCLNMKYSGFDSTALLLFYSFAKRWHIDKFNYYFSLLEEKGDEK